LEKRNEGNTEGSKGRVNGGDERAGKRDKKGNREIKRIIKGKKGEMGEGENQYERKNRRIREKIGGVKGRR